jgi:hypothetical protein
VTITDPILFWMGVAMAAVSTTLLISSALMMGRKLADLSYQRAAGLNGVRRIQSIINIRTQANRVALGLAFLIAAFLIVFDLELWWRTLAIRSMVIAVLLGYTLSATLDWLDEDRQMKILLREPDGHRHPDRGPDGRAGVGQEA